MSTPIPFSIAGWNSWLMCRPPFVDVTARTPTYFITGCYSIKENSRMTTIMDRSNASLLAVVVCILENGKTTYFKVRVSARGPRWRPSILEGGKVAR
jgi:hypothetical protein